MRGQTGGNQYVDMKNKPIDTTRQRCLTAADQKVRKITCCCEQEPRRLDLNHARNVIGPAEELTAIGSTRHEALTVNGQHFEGVHIYRKHISPGAADAHSGDSKTAKQRGTTKNIVQTVQIEAVKKVKQSSIVSIK